MTNQTDSPVVRHWRGRAAGLAGATLLFSLSAAPGAHADGGLLGDVTEVVGGVTDPVVQPVVQTVQSAVPQPVQQAVEPTVSQVVEPVVSHAEQTVKAVVGSTEQAAQPVVEVVKPEVRPAEEPVVQPQEETADQGVGSAPAAPAPQEPVATGPTGSPAVDASSHQGAEQVSAATRGPRADRRPAALARPTAVTDRAPRGVAENIALRPSAEREDASADGTWWRLTNALMHMWAGHDAPHSVDAGLPGDAAAGARAVGTIGITLLLPGVLMGCLSLALRRRLLASLDAPR